MKSHNGTTRRKVWYTVCMNLNDVKSELRQGNRVLLMVRHAERPHIDHDNPTFGAALPITENGRLAAEAYGARLREFAADTQFYASPLRRTVMTAAAIAKGMGLTAPHIPTDDKLGNDTFYFADQSAVFELFRDGSFYEKVFAYLRDGRQIGFADLHAATDALEEWALKRFTGRLGIFTTHDLYNGAYLVARGVVSSFTVETWIQFLDAAAIIVQPDGRKRYALVRNAG